METIIDTSNNVFIESKFESGGAVRVSFIRNGWTEGNCIRVNIVAAATGKIYPGAEIPLENIEEVIAGIVKLVRENSNLG